MSDIEKVFIKTVWNFYSEYGRHSLPWRKTKNPYRILVSELMLQQTQVDRVIPKYTAFLKRWPTVRQLAAAPLGEVLKEWQGLGYNRRAKFLWETANAVVKEYKGVFPKTTNELQALPGVGPYTASAVAAFAYNQPSVLIETNVRTVFIHHFYSTKSAVTDAEILELVSKTLPVDDARNWYAALMDYGSFLKRTTKISNTKSAHYKKQRAFKGSDREVRGAILKLVTNSTKVSIKVIQSQLPFESDRLLLQLEKLKKEGMLVKKNNSYRLP